MRRPLLKSKKPGRKPKKVKNNRYGVPRIPRKVFEEMPVYLRDRNPADDLLPWNIDPGELKHLAEHV